MTTQTTTELRTATAAMAANGIATARRAADAGTAQTLTAMETSLKPTVEALSKAGAFSRGNIEAVAQSTQTYLKGLQDLNRQYFASLQGLVQHAVEGANAFVGVKSLKDAMAIQASLGRATVERALGESTKLQQAARKVAEQVYAPLTRRTTAALAPTTFSRAA